jgi:hypothetical protein
MAEARRDEADRKAIFRCFRSRALIKGEELSFDGRTSARLKGQAIRRGFTGLQGGLRRTLSPLERIVIRMRIATTGEAYNHEWWADWASAPDWFKKFHEVFLESWLFYPPKGTELEAEKLGDKIGYEFEYQRRKLERASSDPDFVERWKLAEYGPPEPLVLPPELKDEEVVYHYLIDGYTDWREYSVEQFRKLKLLQGKILKLLPKLGDDGVPFTKGMSVGGVRAQAVDLDIDLDGTHEREHVLRILERYYDLIAQLPNRRKIADFIVARLPKDRQKFLKNEAQYRAFTERLRHTYFSKIDLGPAARGMPRKSEKMTPHRSRLLIYTPDIASRRETKSI